MTIRVRSSWMVVGFLIMAALWAGPSAGVAQEAAAPAEKPFLGVAVEPSSEGLGVVVAAVAKEGPAEAAGLKPGDIIESINGAPISKIDEMASAMKGKGVGAVVKIVVNRDGKPITANVTLTPTPAGAPSGGEKIPPPEKGPPGAGEEEPPPPLPDPDSTARPSAPLGAGPPRPYLGLTVVRHEGGGAAISSIRKDSPAAKVGFPLGGVIVKVNDTPVNNPDDLINFIASMEPGKTIELSYTHNDRLFRKSVKLSSIGGAIVSRAEPEVVAPPAATPEEGAMPLEGVPPREERPILGGIGRVLGGAPLGAAADSAALQREITDLKAVIAALEERIAKIEAELAAFKTPKKEEVPPPPATGAAP